MKLIQSLLPFILFNFAESYNILALFLHHGKSHMIGFEHLLETLAVRGHNVTVVSYFPGNKKIDNYKNISVRSKIFTLTEEIPIAKHDGSLIGALKAIVNLSRYAKMACEEYYENVEIQNLIKGEEHFDVVMSEFFISDCLLGFVYKFKAPLIGLSSSGTILATVLERFGNPSNPSYIHNQFYNHIGITSFFDRLINTSLHLFSLYVGEAFMLPFDNDITNKNFGNGVPNVRDIYMNSSLVLCNSHFSLIQPIPLVPSIVQVGGLHLGKNEVLPKNIEKWINESRDGVIYFSMGSMIKGHTFPEDKRQMFLRVFERLPQRVLWKWESENMPGKPDNVMIQRWMPQFDILCHPNVKVFISHGGMLGTTETVHCGVPALVMPQFGDQFTNARALEASGGGLVFDFWRGDEETLYQALKKLLDPSFKKQAEQLSARFRDRPLPPLETAIYWVEYVARHGGAHHMRTAAVGMPLYKYLLLDVVAFLVFVLLSFLFITYKLSKFVIRKVIGRSAKVKTN